MKITHRTENFTCFPNIETCDGGHCAFYFPQFRRLDEDEFFASLARVLKEEEDTSKTSYFKSAYNKNYAELMDVYIRASTMEFYDAVQLVCSQKDGYIRHDIYFGLHGELCELMPCCK